MKANKFFALAVAALALVACGGNGDGNTGGGETPDALVLDKNQATIEVEGEVEIKANLACEYAADALDVVALTPANDGKSVKVVGLKAGRAIVSATAAGQTKTCVVKVNEKGQGGGGNVEARVLQCSKFWPIFMDETTLNANMDKLGADFRYNGSDQVNFYFPWSGANYEFVEDAAGMNAAGNTDGYVALKVTAGGSWAGGGIAIVEDSELGTAATELLAAVAANPDDYYIHMAVKSTDNASHCFYFFACEAMSFVLGENEVYGGKKYANFERDGKWHEFDIPLSTYSTALAAVTGFKGTNIFVALSEYIPGAVLNMDLIYIYKK